MDETSVRWLRRLVTRALDLERQIFDEILTAKPRQVAFRYADNQTESMNVSLAPSEMLRKFLSPESEAGSILFFCASEEEHEVEGAQQALKIIDAVRNEFKSNLVKFASQITNAIQQIQGDIHLIIPDVVITKPESHLDDYELINTLEQAIEEWSKSIASVVDQEARKVPKRKGPLAEIEFWRERNATLSTIYEQINMPHVQKMIKLLELVEASMLLTFKYHFSELSKLYIEAKDNVKFLTTLERHFKNIATIAKQAEMWKDDYGKILYEVVKDQFRGVTKQDVVEFADKCRDMKREFLEHGPATSASDLDAGLELVADFKKRVAQFKARRQELANAENLFALPITSYPELQDITEALEKQDLIYTLYTEQKDFITTLAGMLWAELDVPSMNRGIDELEKKCRKFPKELKAMSTFQEVEKQILAFKDSIPLIQSLKNDAMKPRHWEELMAVTKVRFEMNLKTFTLANLFAMKLHRFSNEIGEIVNAAMQEQKIEQEILKVEDAWAKNVLELVKYRKNGQDRGWVLRAADDLKLMLEDHMLNLQTMSGSRFIASFADRVRKWERKLGVVNECYAGRTELPDNLKALFRPVTMIVPDLLQICQIMLFSEGFEMAVTLAKKMTVLYKLSREQLSKQYHYDFGLRALKSVLVMAGSLKREYSDMREDLVLMRALRDSNMPKFVFEDVPLFQGLINDLFPGLDCPRVGYAALKTAIEQELENGEFRCQDDAVYTEQVDKVIQMGMKTERPMLFVGESGTAKTVTIQNYLKDLDQQVISSLMINFSSRTSSLDVQTNIQANVDKRSGKIYGPPAGKKLVLFIDDLNMPKVDLYGTQQPIALLHFVMGRGCIYDRGKELDLRILKDLLFLGAMGPPGGGRNPVDPRFVALFNVYNLTPPTKDVLRQIYGAIVTTYLRNFSDNVREAGGKLTDALLRFFDVVVERLPPTPSKFHYIFNLRDLGRVCEGICMATPDKFDSAKSIVRLWRNEVKRVFCDRLTSDADHTIVDGAIATILKESFAGSNEVIDHALVDPIIFGDYSECIPRLTGQATSEDPRLYQDMESYKRIRSIFDEALETYNLDRKPMALVLFEMALEHLSRILRIIRNPLGHALLIGVGGSGKQSLSRLAAFTAGYELFEIFLTRGYGENEFRENLKDLYRKLGKQKVVFLFTDAHAVEEGFLEFINNMLTTGMVPALFEQDERDGLASSVRDEVKAAGLLETSENCWKFYVNRCRQNLHLILAMSPSGSTLRTRCRNFPGLVSATVIDWFFPWPEDALRNVAQYFLAEEKIPEELRPEVTNHLVHAHLRVVQVAHQFAEELRRFYYVTPKNYLDLISNYRQQLKENNQKVNASIARLRGGLTKLVEAAEAVDRMQVELSEKKVIVDEKTLACEALIKTIEEKSAVATKQQEVAASTQIECEKASIMIAKEKEEADAALLEALPAVEAAAAALQDLSKADLTEIKTFASPPPLVMSVCMCVLILKPTGQELDLDWKGAKMMLSNPNLITLLKEYEKDKISSKMIAKIKTFFKNPDLNVENMKSISRAGAGLLVWVVAIVKYHEVAKNVEPLRQKVKQMEKEQAIKEQELEDLKATLERLKNELDSLSKQFHEANTELQGLKSQADQMQKRLTAASKLLAGLGSERNRWTKDVESLNLQGERLTGDCLLTASFLSYAGAFSFDYRTDLIYKDFYEDIARRSLPVTSPFRLENSLTTDATIQKWVSEGLPADEHSVQNGILTTKASRFPLCIDPQQQAVNWIKKREEKNNLTIKTLSDSDFMKHLELAIQFGNPFLFESVDEELDPILDPVLEKATFMEGSQRFIKLGDKNVEWDPNFRLYFTSKLANPHYSPEVMGKTMIVNYSVTQHGLANQLLNVVVAHERPDLEDQYRDLVTEMSENTQMIVELEDTLLRELSNSTGNILDNEELIATLDETKNKATEIGTKLELSSFTKDEITKARAVYTPVAMRGSILYFAMSALSTIMKIETWYSRNGSNT
ncbi:hypothetical protein P43SY_010922 [Pythium insidiosum]|uniref:AAA+ ATPase domain-containing protein n=1 Tax=Pythium insidiosum TaxID=114742 RepID=A0AAD5LWM0_PYTIN|nr:hypothetical protein P43SY_010922 [Pythium insidiosum]